MPWTGVTLEQIVNIRGDRTCRIRPDSFVSPKAWFMLEQLRQQLRALEKPAGIGDGPGTLPLGVAAIDDTLGGGFARGALHEIAAASEAHLAAATGFALGLIAPMRARVCWLVEDMALAESGAPYGPGLEAFGLAPECLL